MIMTESRNCCKNIMSGARPMTMAAGTDAEAAAAVTNVRDRMSKLDMVRPTQRNLSHLRVNGRKLWMLMK